VGRPRRHIEWPEPACVAGWLNAMVNTLTGGSGEGQACSNGDELDRSLMRRCIGHSREAIGSGEFPFACLIARGPEVIAQAINRVEQDGDVTRHAEIVALSHAQRILKSKRLDGCTLYSNVEPCAMCAFPIRESRIDRVVFALASPLMGGFSRWNVLTDDMLSHRMPEAFGAAPEIVSGLLADEAAAIWREWNPLVWSIVRFRGCFEEPPEINRRPPSAMNWFSSLFSPGRHRAHD
jgi:tRNA(adenine34) deaminase